MSTNYFTYAVPVFIGAMITEAVVTWKKGKPTYTWSDTFANLGNGMGSQLSGLFIAAATFGVYDSVYQRRLLDLEPGGVMAWLLALFGVDLAYYWYHRLSHEVNVFWATHVVHHQSEEYNLSVALRQSWFSGIYSWIFYIPLAVLGVPPALYILSYSINLLYQFIIHTRAVDRMGPLELVLNTPSHHRVHHGSNQCYLDKNYAGVLIIWDRMFGTFIEEGVPVEYGLVKPLKSYNPVWSNLHFWVDLVKETIRLPGINKLKIWVKNPGWQPGDRSRDDAARRAEGRVYQKHVLKAPIPTLAYVFLQLVAVNAGTVIVMALGQTVPASVLFFIYGGSLSSLILWQGLLQGDALTLRAEGGLLALMAIGSWLLVTEAGLPDWAGYGLGAYLVLSIGLFVPLLRRRQVPSSARSVAA